MNRAGRSREADDEVIEIPAFLRNPDNLYRETAQPLSAFPRTAAMMDRTPKEITQAMERAAITKAGNIDGWRPFLYQRAQTGGTLVTGCMTRPRTTGPNQGRPEFLTSERRIKVLITAADVDRALSER